MDDEQRTDDTGNPSESAELGNGPSTDAGGTGEPDGSSGAIDPGSYIREPGKRGRHPNGCPCDKCAAKRSGGLGTSEPARASSSKGPKPKAAPLDIAAFGKQITGAHAIAALLLKSPVIAINDVQGQELAIAIRDLAAQYEIKPNPRVMAWLKLGGISAMVYGPKLMLVAASQKAKREQQRVNKPAFMPDIPPAPKPPSAAPNGGMGGINFPDPFGTRQ